jgi:hypothetical protein
MLGTQRTPSSRKSMRVQAQLIPRVNKMIDFADSLRQNLAVGEKAMIALFKKRVPGTPSSRGKRSARQQQSTTPVNPNSNIHFEVGWTDSWNRRCMHEHHTLIEAARCAKFQGTGAGWYVFAVEDGNPRQLRSTEEEVVNRFRFGPRDSKEN